jgi:nitroreductase
MDALEAIMTTRAIRRFTQDPVSEDDLWTCLRAAQQAPSGGNVQPTRYLVVTDPDVRTRVGELYRSAFARYTEVAPGGPTPPACASAGRPSTSPTTWRPCR